MVDSEDKALAEARTFRWPDPDKSIRILEQFLGKHGHAIRTRLLLASLYADEYGDGVMGAERLYREVLHDEPDNISALCGLALLHGRGTTVEMDESLRLLAKASELSEDPEILMNYANKAWDVGRFDDALAAFEKLLAISSAQQKDYLAIRARVAIQQVRAKRRPDSLAYSWPEM